MRISPLFVGSIVGIMLLTSACSFPGKSSPSDESYPKDSYGCSVKPTNLGSIEGKGLGDAIDKDTSLTIEYALYDTCGKSLQGTRESRISFDAVAGTGLVVGFSNALMGMKEGQTREFTLSPEDAYGASGSTIVIPVPKNILEGVIVREVDANIYKDNARITQSLGSPVDTTRIKIGDTFASPQDPSVIARVAEIKEDMVTLEYDNTKSPFYKKPLTVGTKGSMNGAEYEILSASGSNLTISEKLPSRSVFASSDITIGAKVKVAENSILLLNKALNLSVGDEVEIVSISGEEIGLAIPHPGEMVGRSLVFSIKIASVKK